MTEFIAARFGGPVTTMLRLSLEAAPNKTSTLEVHNAKFWHLVECDVEAGWKTIFQSFVNHLNKG